MDWTPFIIGVLALAALVFLLNIPLGGQSYRQLVKSLHQKSFIIIVVLAVVLLGPFALILLHGGGH